MTNDFKRRLLELRGTAPGLAALFISAALKSEGPLYVGGPAWRIELISPVWPRPPAAK